MDEKLTITEQNLILTASYIRMNEEGRDLLDMVIQKLVKMQLCEKASGGIIGNNFCQKHNH
jgi:hypothetical protein